MSLGHISIAGLYITTSHIMSLKQRSALKTPSSGLWQKGATSPILANPKRQRPFEIPKEAMDAEPIVALLQADFPNTPYPQDANSNGYFENTARHSP